LVASHLYGRKELFGDGENWGLATTNSTAFSQFVLHCVAFSCLESRDMDSKATKSVVDQEIGRLFVDLEDALADMPHLIAEDFLEAIIRRAKFRELVVKSGQELPWLAEVAGDFFLSCETSRQPSGEFLSVLRHKSRQTLN
jgi:hypothetical protein